MCILEAAPAFPSVAPPRGAGAALPRPSDLPLAHYRLEWEAAQPLEDPQYLGSAWRGVFGHCLRRLVCVSRAPQCQGCLLLHTCSYPYLFETPGEASAHAAAPHPLILKIENSRCPSGGPYRLGFVLVGRAIPLVGYVVRAFEQAASRGVTTRDYRFRLLGVRQENPTGSGLWTPILAPDRRLLALPAAGAAIPPCPDQCRIRLLTPLRLRKEGAYVRDSALLGEFAASVLRRLLLMLRFHGPGPVEDNLAPLFQAARNWQPLDASLRWHDWTRYSNRQQTSMQMGGWVGEMLVSPRELPELWPWLWVGQYIHGGKGASMGLGAYRLEPVR